MRLRQSPSGPAVTLPSFPDVPQTNNVGSTATIDWSKGAAQKLLLVGTAALVSNGLPAGDDAWVQLLVEQGGSGGHALTVPGAKTPGGAPLTLSSSAGSIDLISGYWDGATMFWTVGGLDFQ